MSAFDQPHLLKLPQCTLRYFDEGSGRVVLFVQGIWTSQQLWLGVVRNIGAGVRCLRVEWPLGGHNEPVPPGVDLSPFAIAKLVLDFIEALDLEDVTLIGNDTGGAVCLLAVTMFDHSAWHRLSGLVLTNSDSYENFPPRAFLPIQWLAKYVPPIAGAVTRWITRAKAAPAFIESVCATAVPADVAVGLLACVANNKASRRDSMRFLAGADARRTTLPAARRFKEMVLPVLIIWGDADQFFPLTDGERLSAAFPRAKLSVVSGARTYLPLDAPERVAQEILGFLGENRMDAHTDP